MGKFNRGGGGGGFGGNRSGGFGGRDSGKPSFQKKSWGDRPDMHKATCSACNKSCEVPFRPSGDKPVYCSDCFGKQGGGANRTPGGAPRREFGDRAPRPSFGGGERATGSDEAVKRQLDTLSSKIDRLANLVEGLSKNKNTPVADITAQEKIAIKALTSTSKKAAVKPVVKAPAKKVVKKVVAKKGKK